MTVMARLRSLVSGTELQLQGRGGGKMFRMFEFARCRAAGAFAAPTRDAQALYSSPHPHWSSPPGPAAAAAAATGCVRRADAKYVTSTPNQLAQRRRRIAFHFVHTYRQTDRPTDGFIGRPV